MATLSRISWDTSYSVNVEVLDAQHRNLFAIVNRVINLTESRSSDLLPAIKELIDYLSVHFREEHAVMTSANYPNLLNHRKEHLKFTETVEEFLKSYKEGDKELGLKMVVFMKDWIHDHTKKIDVKYGEYLLKYAPRLTQPQK
ncbi:MAG: bacteriohemerythrin [Methanomicrobiales archaeon]